MFIYFKNYICAYYFALIVKLIKFPMHQMNAILAVANEFPDWKTDVQTQTEKSLFSIITAALSYKGIIRFGADVF